MSTSLYFLGYQRGRMASLRETQQEMRDLSAAYAEARRTFEDGLSKFKARTAEFDSARMALVADNIKSKEQFMEVMDMYRSCRGLGPADWRELRALLDQMRGENKPTPGAGS